MTAEIMSVPSILKMLVPGSILVATAVALFANNAIAYLTYLNALETDSLNPQYCNGVRCFCNNLECITKEEREGEFLYQNLMASSFLGAGIFLLFLFYKSGNFRARHIAR